MEPDEFTLQDWRGARARAGLSQRDLARRLGVTQSAISRFESGRGGISRKRLLALLQILLKAQAEIRK